MTSSEAAPSPTPSPSPVIAVSIRPGAPRTEIIGQLGDGTLKVAVAAPPEKGRANQELLRFLCEHYRLPREGVRILSGHTGRKKLIRLREG